MKIAKTPRKKIAKTPPRRITISLQIQYDIYTALKSIAKRHKIKSKSELIRIALLQLLESEGVDTTEIENPTWGVRRDIASGDENAIEQAKESVGKARAARRARREAAMDEARVS